VEPPEDAILFSWRKKRHFRVRTPAKDGKSREKPKKSGVFRDTGLHFRGIEDILSRHRNIHQSSIERQTL
jgi:hypothetical protein